MLGWLAWLAGVGGWAGAADALAAEGGGWPQYGLRAQQWWLLNLPGGRRFDASALLRLPDGEMWTVNDQFNAVYRMRFPAGAGAGAGTGGTNAIDVEPVAGLFTGDQVAQVSGGSRLRLDCEGLARDGQGRIYIAEEARRMILRWDPMTTRLEKLAIDWSPVRRYFESPDANASFEGVAVGGDRLYVANERQVGRIIVVDLATLGVIDHFAVASAGSTTKDKDTHYSDLCWADGALWVLLRDERKILKVDPMAKAVRAEFDYSDLETASETAYGLIFAPGFMEGLAVDDDFLWLLVDNNGFRRRAKAGDARPTLYKCRRPDVALR